jgi:hypothetical protein
MTKQIKLSEEFTLGTLLEFIFYNADTKKVNFCMYFSHEAFQRIKDKYSKEFSNLYFYRTGNMYHSRELEMYLSNFATWGILETSTNNCELRFFNDNTKACIKRDYEKANPSIIERVEEITDSLIESYRQVLKKFNDSSHRHEIKWKKKT